ncbi:hypothetical protein LQ567_11955 [Niabella pedocola]|uniref:Uncharacterized protein n=1 Tax=Niabella pedocola TaxID=1752077 RepID=A0ABS8PQX0_9BACT|nr:hypothetical protein [Niabella pedocola]MCD2423480.1 hypothetical protein [Niabella pedocola]
MDNGFNFLRVNWSDGMKLNKELFIAQDNAAAATAYQLRATTLSPIRYGLIPDEKNFNVRLAIDNQHTLRVSVLALKALTRSGVPVIIDAFTDAAATDGVPAVSLELNSSQPATGWVVLLAKPFERNPAGTIDPDETPARFPFVKSGYSVQIADERNIQQYDQHPLAIIIGKIIINGNGAQVDEEYIPPCMAPAASPDLLGLHAELDQFLAGLEQSCSMIVQKIYKKSQQNALSELARFLCDRMMLFLGQVITEYRWSIIHESPAKMLSHIAALARVIKNTIDLRIGSGKDELMSYLCEWCELNQGELEGLLSEMALLRYNHYDINENIRQVIQFAKVIGKLFTTLSNLEFIGKRKDSGLFVKEEQSFPVNDTNAPKPKRRFFG